MTVSRAAALRRLPAVHEVMKTLAAGKAVTRFGRAMVVAGARAALNELRSQVRGGIASAASADAIAEAVSAQLDRVVQPRLRPVYNQTGTVLHTNLGRALLAENAVEAATTAMRQAMALEFDLEAGRRGERDTLIRDLLCGLTGAEDSIVVNNNAAAVLMTLNTLAMGREVIVSRGELIEIGGSFRLPAIMARAGAKLIEVGTTNRTHASDYEEAISPQTALILKVHPSNYRIEGFTAAVDPVSLAALAHSRGVPLVNDLGSGTLIDLSHLGVGHEPTVAESVRAGADLVTFSGDKLLGGPQAGFIVGRTEFIEKINRNPLKRAVRVDKIRLAAIEATLGLYRDPDRLAEQLPTLRHLTKTRDDIARLAKRLLSELTVAVGDEFLVLVIECESQIGSGALPRQTLPSAGLAIRSASSRSGHALSQLAKALRRLPIPVIGRVENDALILDLRCLDDEAGFASNLKCLNLAPGPREVHS